MKKRMIISVDNALFLALVAHKAKTGASVSEIIRRAAKEYLEGDKKEPENTI